MKILHVCPKDIYLKHRLNFRGHALDLPNGMVVMISEMNQHAQAQLEAETGVLPFPFILSSEPVGLEIARHLAEHGVLESHKAFEAVAKIAKTHEGFAFSQF
ncbi:MAG: hypothetical protein WCC97_08450 [Candidatus Acidiferrales bacterium]